LLQIPAGASDLGHPTTSQIIEFPGYVLRTV
jgi:hypothetical protein